MRLALIILPLFFSLLLSGQNKASIFPQLKGKALEQAVIESYKPATVLNYSRARDLMYAKIDNYQDTVYGIYSRHGIYLPKGIDPSQHLYKDGDPNGINCEHVWPRSKGAAQGNAKSDMHHLFPARVAVNQARGNDPFGEVPDIQTQWWYYQSFGRNSQPASFSKDNYSESGHGIFEPREDKKGDIARAMFYFYTMYRQEAGTEGRAFFMRQLSTLCQWHQMDPPDQQEIKRTKAISHHQDGKVNPFITDPSLPGRIYCGSTE